MQVAQLRWRLKLSLCILRMTRQLLVCLFFSVTFLMFPSVQDNSNWNTPTWKLWYLCNARIFFALSFRHSFRTQYFICLFIFAIFRGDFVNIGLAVYYQIQCLIFTMQQRKMSNLSLISNIEKHFWSAAPAYLAHENAKQIVSSRLSLQRFSGKFVTIINVWYPEPICQNDWLCISSL